ncbi:cytochrome P450 3A29 [Aplysia californica]|uniref:Cytochrome P450 3A29 n=1 Tax=Aplysia californica TaxID=6500 RepID=A0ABM0K146_APLCA|nr:cytochrome P450 3A29 [Aplysia californica]
MVIGNIMQMFDDTIGVRAQIRMCQEQYGRLYGIYFFRKPVIMILDLELLKQVFVKDFGNFRDRFLFPDRKLHQPILRKGLFFEKGDNWHRQRKIMTQPFSSGKLKTLMHHINRTGRYLGDSLALCAREGKMAEAKVVFGAYALDVICGAAFGLDIDCQKNLDHPFAQYARSMMKIRKSAQLKMMCVGLCPPIAHLFDFLRIGFIKNSDIEFFRQNLSALVAERKSDSGSKAHSDFLQLLINAEAEDSEDLKGSKKLTTEEIVAQGILFIMAGYETMSSTLQYIFYEISRNRYMQENIVDEIQRVIGDKSEPTYEDLQKLKYTEAVINETLRYYPPIHLVPRESIQEVKLGPYVIPAKTGIIIPIWNIMRDPEYFSDPDCFQPERFLDDKKQTASMINFLPFGYGPRQCAGMRMAMIELKSAIVQVMKRVEMVSALPEVLDIEDYTGFLVPKQPIQLQMKAKDDA